MDQYSRGVHSFSWSASIILCLISLSCVVCESYLADEEIQSYYIADIKYKYIVFDKDKKPNHPETVNIEGKYGSELLVNFNANASGKVVHVVSASRKDRSKVNHFGCTSDYQMPLPKSKWIALVSRGDCEFSLKVKIATQHHNASGIVIYNNETNPSDTLMKHTVPEQVAVLISKEDGLNIARLLKEKKADIMMDIRKGRKMKTPVPSNANNSSVLFVAISFIVIVFVSVVWLLIFYTRRWRNSHEKERRAKRLARAAKKVIAKIPEKTVGAGDKELDGEFDQCAVCIEPYKDGDVLRIMPCRHVFHKFCVDPWLLDQRTCPMCKLDILQAYGMSMCQRDFVRAYDMQGSQDSVHNEGGDRSGHQTTQQESSLGLDDQDEASSSLDDDVDPRNREVKVVLVPHSCVHFHHHHDHSEPSVALEEEDETDVPSASTGLLSSCRKSLGDDETHVPSASTGLLSSRSKSLGEDETDVPSASTGLLSSHRKPTEVKKSTESLKGDGEPAHGSNQSLSSKGKGASSLSRTRSEDKLKRHSTPETETLIQHDEVAEVAEELDADAKQTMDISSQS